MMVEVVGHEGARELIVLTHEGARMTPALSNNVASPFKQGTSVQRAAQADRVPVLRNCPPRGTN